MKIDKQLSSLDHENGNTALTLCVMLGSGCIWHSCAAMSLSYLVWDDFLLLLVSVLFNMDLGFLKVHGKCE